MLCFFLIYLFWPGKKRNMISQYQFCQETSQTFSWTKVCWVMTTHKSTQSIRHDKTKTSQAKYTIKLDHFCVTFCPIDDICFKYLVCWLFSSLLEFSFTLLILVDNFNGVKG